MAFDLALELLKADIGLSGQLPEATQKMAEASVETAVSELEKDSKITLDETSTSDNFLVMRYASWLYKAGNNPDTKRPWALQRMINNAVTRKKDNTNGTL